LRGQIALITGATRGIGLAIAQALATEGCDLILTGRGPSALARIRRELSRGQRRILAEPCDVRDPGSVETLFRATRKQFGRLDILINNAGIAHPHLPIDQLPFALWRDVMATNLDGMFLITQAALPVMKRGGTIVNNLSIAATRVFAGSAAYNVIQARSTGLYQHAARGIAAKRSQGHRPPAGSHRHRHLENAMAAGAAPQNDVA